MIIPFYHCKWMKLRATLATMPHLDNSPFGLTTKAIGANQGLLPRAPLVRSNFMPIIAISNLHALDFDDRVAVERYQQIMRQQPHRCAPSERYPPASSGRPRSRRAFARTHPFRLNSRESVDAERPNSLAMAAGLIPISSCVWIIVRSSMLNCL
jgi:hypothetical protein